MNKLFLIPLLALTVGQAHSDTSHEETHSADALIAEPQDTETP